VLAGVTLRDPETAREPLQPPVAVHDDALAADQFNVVLPPDAIEFGLADIVAVGAVGVLDPTVTVTDFDAEPPLPVQVTV